MMVKSKNSPQKEKSAAEVYPSKVVGDVGDVDDVVDSRNTKIKSTKGAFILLVWYIKNNNFIAVDLGVSNQYVISPESSIQTAVNNDDEQSRYNSKNKVKRVAEDSLQNTNEASSLQTLPSDLDLSESDDIPSRHHSEGEEYEEYKPRRARSARERAARGKSVEAKASEPVAPAPKKRKSTINAVRPYPCNSCDKAFTQQAHLSIHKVFYFFKKSV